MGGGACQHVRREARLHEPVGLVAILLRVLLAFFEDVEQVLERADVDRYGQVVEDGRHGRGLVDSGGKDPMMCLEASRRRRKRADEERSISFASTSSCSEAAFRLYTHLGRYVLLLSAHGIIDLHPQVGARTSNTSHLPCLCKQRTFIGPEPGQASGEEVSPRLRGGR